MANNEFCNKKKHFFCLFGWNQTVFFLLFTHACFFFAILFRSLSFALFFYFAFHCFISSSVAHSIIFLFHGIVRGWLTLSEKGKFNVQRVVGKEQNCQQIFPRNVTSFCERNSVRIGQNVQNEVSVRPRRKICIVPCGIKTIKAVVKGLMFVPLSCLKSILGDPGRGCQSRRQTETATHSISRPLVYVESY